MLDWDLTELSSFVAVVDALSFSRAADRLGVTGSALSKRIKALEQRLGIALLERSSHLVRMTDAGQRFVEHARRALDELQRAQGVVGGLALEPAGVLRVGVAGDIVAALLAPSVARFCVDHSAVDLVLVPVAVDAGWSGDHDVLITADPPASGGFVVRPIARFDWSVVASPGLAARLAASVPRDLASARVVVLREGPLSLRLVHARTRNWQDVEVVRQVVVDGVLAARVLLAAGAGIGLMPGYLVDDSIARGDLVRVLPDWRPVNTPCHALHAVHRRTRQPVPKVASFITTLAASLRPPAR